MYLNKCKNVISKYNKYINYEYILYILYYKYINILTAVVCLLHFGPQHLKPKPLCFEGISIDYR
jgi:hypothetical protein